MPVRSRPAVAALDSTFPWRMSRQTHYPMEPAENAAPVAFDHACRRDHRRQNFRLDLSMVGRIRSSAVDDVTIARALHVLAVVLWIGGVAFVTTVLLPAVRNTQASADRVVFFENVERRFSGQARFMTALAGLTGFYMLVRLDLWDRFLSVAYWWMHAMVTIWLLFALMLFVAEPLFLHRWLLARAKTRPESTFELVERLHQILLALSLITLIGAVLGSHGVLVIG
jgi:uncharacterized membrane protein